MTFTQTLLLAACAAAPLALPYAARAGSLQYLYTFSVSGEAQGENFPVGPLVAKDGLLYGTAQGGGESGLQGALFSVDPETGKEVNLYTFPYTSSNTKPGAEPNSGLIVAGGKLYGTTVEGHGATEQNQHYFGYGVVFSLNTTTGKVSTIHGFAGTDGSQPELYHDPLVPAGGALYGTTFYEGPHGTGTVFKLVPGKSFSEIATFATNASGCNPAGIAVSGSTLYGTTTACGKNGSGTIYRIDLATLAEKVIYDFPANTLAVGQPIVRNGALIGTTSSGGANGAGSVYKIDLASGAFRLLHSFSTTGTDGNFPSAGLTVNKGVVYGVTQYGPGENDFGTLFSIDTDTGAEAVLANFSYSGVPMGSLISYRGALFGTTTNYGAENSVNNGTVFRYTP